MSQILKKVEHWSCRGVLPVEEMREVLLQVIAFIGMTPAQGRTPALWWYPCDGGHGGQGYTLIQPLTESYIGAVAFISADIYEKNLAGESKNQTEIILASCEECDPVAVGLLLRKLIGPLVGDPAPGQRRALCGGGGGG